MQERRAATGSKPSARVDHALKMIELHQEDALRVMSMTGEDLPYCYALLEENSWNLGRAVDFHMSGRARTPNMTANESAYAQAGREEDRGKDMGWISKLSDRGKAALSRLNSSPMDAIEGKPQGVSEARGHGPTMAALGSGRFQDGEPLAIPDISAVGSRAVQVKAGWIPARLRGGTLIRLSASSKDVRWQSSDEESGVSVGFETVEPANVYVCVHKDLVFRGMTPDWLMREGFFLCDDSVVAAEDPVHGYFLLFRSASLSLKHWRLGNNATNVPEGSPVPGHMFFVVVTALDSADELGVLIATSGAPTDPSILRLTSATGVVAPTAWDLVEDALPAPDASSSSSSSAVGALASSALGFLGSFAESTSRWAGLP
jgi:hypothetical protein